MVNCGHGRSPHCCDHDCCDFLATRKLAGAHSTAKHRSICKRAFPSTFARNKSTCSCHTLRSSDSSSNNSMCSHSKTDYGTEFQGRISKANCPSYLSWLGKKP